MLRITTGTAKNKKLVIPAIEGYRGVQEIAKSAVFSIIGKKIENTTCLDLYAGSGNLGLEALSRGAKWCNFVDEHPEAIKAIEENLFNCGFVDNFQVFRKDCVKFAENTENRYDLIFADPFYTSTSVKHLFKQVVRILAPGGYLVFFHSKEFDVKEITKDIGLNLLTERRFGASAVSVFC